MIDLLAAVRWWIALSVIGLTALPLVYSLFRRLPDRGYAFVRPAGMLLVAYVFWMAGTLGFAGNDGGGLLLALAVTGGLSWLAYRRRPAADPPLRQWLRDNLTTVVVTELVFLAVFALWVWVRAQNPSITATEKPMEFAFLNGVAQSPAFPPLDPWLSGYAISYYYFGYVMTSMLAQMAFVPTAVAFNLAIAWVVAGTATGAFGLVVNLISLFPNTRYEIRDTKEGRSPDTRNEIQNTDEDDTSVSRISYFVSRSALLWGLIAVLAIPLAGNLQMGLELLHGNGIGGEGFWAWLDVRDISGPASAAEPARYETANWWWWRTSRVIHEYHLDGRSEEGLEPIVEVPAFSFVLGDLHPHVLALPFAFLSLAVALCWFLEIRGRRDWRLEIGDSETGRLGDSEIEGSRSFVSRISYFVSPLWIFTALVLGGLSFLNTWDVAIHLFVVVGAWFLGHWFARGTTRGLWGRAALQGLALVAAVVLLYLPFYLGFRSQAGAPFLLPFLMRPTRLVHYLIIFGMPLTAVSATLLVLAARQRFRNWRLGLGAAAGLLLALLAANFAFILIVAAGPDNGRLVNLANDLGVSFAGLFPALLQARLLNPWLTLYLAGLFALVVMILKTWSDELHPDTKYEIRDTEESDELGDVENLQSPISNLFFPLPFVLLLILTAVLLTLGPEFLYLRDNFGVRLNTTFKFYYQAWGMFGVAAVVGLHYLWSTRRGAAARGAAAAAVVVYGALLAVALLFPVYAVRSRAAEYRGPARDAAGAPQERQPATLDGLAWMARFNPAELEAIEWLQAQSAERGGPPPVVLEAVGGQYSNYGRISANSGLPTLLGWPGHEWQWRGGDHPEPGRREPIVEQIYTARDLNAVSFLLDEFNVAYIVVGDLEREKYGDFGLEKFAEFLPVAYSNDRVTIYRWQPALPGAAN